MASNQIGADPILYFVHIPKTAGTSIRKAVDSYHLPQEVFPPEITLYDALDVPLARQLDQTCFSHYRLIRGHHAVEHLQPFMVHCPRTIRRFTVFREPASQLRSEYRMALHDPAYPLHEIWQAEGLTMEQFLAEPRLPWISRGDRQSYHLMRQLVASDEALPPKDEWFDRLVESLEDYACVGIHEQLPLTLQLLCYRFGWRCPPDVPHLNKSAAPEEDSEVEPHLDARIQAENRVDTRLYKWAEDRFEESYQQLLRQLGTSDSAQTVEAINARSAETIRQKASPGRTAALIESHGFGLCHLNRQFYRQLQCIGPAPEAVLTFELFRPLRGVAMEILAWLDESSLTNLRLFANGSELFLKITRDGGACRCWAEIPRGVVAGPPTSLELRISTFSPTLAPAPLYLAVGSLELEPLN